LAVATGLTGCAADFSDSYDTAPGFYNGYTGTEHRITEFRSELPDGVQALLNGCSLPFSLNARTTSWNLLGSCSARTAATRLLSEVDFDDAAERNARIDLYENLLANNPTSVPLKNVFPEELRAGIQQYIYETIDFGVPRWLAFCELNISVTKPPATSEIKLPISRAISYFTSAPAYVADGRLRTELSFPKRVKAADLLIDGSFECDGYALQAARNAYAGSDYNPIDFMVAGVRASIPRGSYAIYLDDLEASVDLDISEEGRQVIVRPNAEVSAFKLSIDRPIKNYDFDAMLAGAGVSAKDMREKLRSSLIAGLSNAPKGGKALPVLFQDMLRQTVPQGYEVCSARTEGIGGNTANQKLVIDAGKVGGNCAKQRVIRW
jgi:hypothetical protein